MASTYTNLLFHIVFSTKNRQLLIAEPVRDELHRYIGGIIRAHNGILLEIGGRPDHVHLLTKLRPDTSVSDMVRLVKANSSKWMNERTDRIGEFAWQIGYGAFTVSESQIAAVREYVRRQEEHHRKMTFQEEYVELLRRHGIEYDEQYLWG